MATKVQLYDEGKRLKDAGQYEEALAKFQESMNLDEKYAVPVHAAVECLTRLGRHEEAISLARKIIELEPDDYFSYIALSRAYQQAGRIPEAEYAMMQGQQAQMRAARH